MRRSIAAMLLVALGAASVGTSAAPATSAVVITNPDWLTRPSGNDMTRYYPALAASVGISGQVILECEVVETGAVQDCRVEAEAPRGLDFGVAAVRMSSLFRMKPRTVNGVAVAGATVRFPIRFTLGPRPGSPDPATTGVDPRLLALAMRLAEARGDRADYLRRAAAAEEMMRRSLDGAAMPADVRQARTAIARLTDEQLKARVDAYMRLRAWEYARQFSEAEMGGLVAFFESPLGKAWAARANDGSGERVLARVFEEARDAVGDAFCREMGCTLPEFSARNAAAAPGE